VLDTFVKYRACAVLRTPKAEMCAPAMQAAIDGGFDIVEFTLTTPGCLDTLADFRSKYDGKVMIGCGTVMDIPDAQAAMDAGAEFLVAPVLVPEVVTWCAMHNIVIIPGCQTPTEAYNAYKAGAPVQKIFPGVAGGHMWVKAVSAALPMLKLNPTSGVDLDNAGDFLKNGASSVGLVAPLFPPDAVLNGKWDVIQGEQRTRHERMRERTRPHRPRARTAHATAAVTYVRRRRWCCGMAQHTWHSTHWRESVGGMVA
jgi:2-dehydro-3-deoxyphosphogluconate aldolase/(4S)-4-hydroxy-2-oxoglutarate aldolase